MAIFLYIVSFASLSLSAGYQNKLKYKIMETKPEIRYAAIGDSYTIGEGAKQPDEAWPALLTHNLKKAGLNISLVANPSKTGWTTSDVIMYELPAYDKCRPSFATLLIGVNDWVQGIDSATFHKNLNFIIDHLQSMLPIKRNLVLVTIPDFSVTPTGHQYARGRDISEGLTEFNNIIKSEAKKRNLEVVDIFPLSKGMKDAPELVAADGLHPSAKEYALWEKIIYPTVFKLLK